MRITASAPGKVAIIGEYAVLEGAPALVMAVDRRARVSLKSHAESYCSVSTLGLAGDQGRFRIEPSGLTWLYGDDSRFKLATHTIAAFVEAGGGRWPARPFHLDLDSASLMNRGGTKKLGLGSSAALVVALCHALSCYAASPHNAVKTLDLCRLIEIHSGFQGRRGSGLDVAASLYGGVIEYSRSPAPNARPRRLPEDMVYCFVWSGREAATGRFLAGIDEWRRNNARGYRRVMDSLAEVARAGVRAARDNDGEEFLRSLAEYVAVLQALGSSSGTDILSEPHRRLRALAKEYGVVYKPCGAGGGDIGVGMSRDPEALAVFQAGLLAENFQPLSLDGDREGVLINISQRTGDNH